MSFNISSSWSPGAAQSERPNTEPSFCECASVWPLSSVRGNIRLSVFMSHPKSRTDTLLLEQVQTSPTASFTASPCWWLVRGQGSEFHVSEAICCHHFPHGWEEPGIRCPTCLFLFMSWLWRLRHMSLILYFKSFLRTSTWSTTWSIKSCLPSSLRAFFQKKSLCN